MALDPSANTCRVYFGSKIFHTVDTRGAFEKQLDLLMGHYHLSRIGLGLNMLTGVRDIEYVACPPEEHHD